MARSLMLLGLGSLLWCKKKNKSASDIVVFLSQLLLLCLQEMEMGLLLVTGLTYTWVAVSKA